MFAQRPPSIKKAVFNFLRGINIKSEKEIIDNVKVFSKSQTPARSINRTLNELFKKGKLQKIYKKDGTFFTWETLKPEDRKKKFARFYKLVSEQYRKQVSTSIYCGTNSIGNADNNPNFLGAAGGTRYRGSDQSPRKTASDIKAWTFDDIENRDKNRFDDLAEFLFIEIMKTRLTSDQNDCMVTQYGVYLKELSFGEFKAMLGYDGLMPMQDKHVLFPKKFWSIRGVEQ